MRRVLLHGGLPAWKQAGLPVANFQQISVDILNDWLRAGKTRLLDVRREGEWKAGHIQGAVWSPLDTLDTTLPEIDRGALVAVHCKSRLSQCDRVQRIAARRIQQPCQRRGRIGMPGQPPSLPVVTEEPVKV